jgi:hypothetical protein
MPKEVTRPAAGISSFDLSNGTDYQFEPRSISPIGDFLKTAK